MVPSSSSSSSEDNGVSASRATACNSNCLLSSAFRHLTFPGKPLCRTPRPGFQTPFTGNLRTLQATLVSAADKFVQTLRCAAARNPFVSFYIRVMSQANRRNSSSSNCLRLHNFAAILPGDSVAGLVVSNGILSFLNIYNTLLVVRLVLTWFPNSPPAIVSPLSTICDPYLNIFRGLIPPLGGTLDLSPILAFLVLNAFTSAAAALPAELPTSASSTTVVPSGSNPWNLTTTQQKWMQRVSRNSSNCENSS